MSHRGQTRYRKPCETHHEQEQTQSAAGPDPDLNGIDSSSSNLKMHLSSSHRAVPPQPSNTPEWDNLHQTEELSHSELRNTCHKCRRRFFFFFPQTGDTCLSLKKDYLRCVSSPPAVALCHLRPAAAFSPPKAVEQTLPSVRSPQPLCAVNFQRSIWLLNASGPKGESNSPIFLRTARIFTVAGAWACRRRLKIFVRGAGQDDAPQIFKMNSALPLLSKQLCPRKSNCFFFYSLKVKCCDWVFYINIRSWQGAFAHWCLS